MIDRIRRLGYLAETAAPDVADAVRASLQKSIASGTDPDGKAWAPRKGGGTALQYAAKAVAVAPIGTRVFVRLSGVEARHHLGLARGGVVRRIIPVDRIPRAMAEDCIKAIADHFHFVMAGGV
ncbi:MAG: hypothetical protein H0X39_00505 [Actinobacteria bacterium]|nr:hypothetical protein [Actinomycetota bacterium]